VVKRSAKIFMVGIAQVWWNRLLHALHHREAPGNVGAADNTPWGRGMLPGHASHFVSMLQLSTHNAPMQILTDPASPFAATPAHICFRLLRCFSRRLWRSN
jgi:hypothetical protein